MTTLSLLLTLLLLSPEDHAEKTVSPLQAMDIFELETATDPRIAPDGSRIVYVRHYCDIKTDRRYTNLWTVDVDGERHRPLTTGLYHDSTPRWSPSGDRLAFVSDRDGTAQIYIRWMDTGETAKVSRLSVSPRSLSWSPDGNALAFSALIPGKGRTIAKLPPTPPGAKWAAPAMVIDRTLWRWDGAGALPRGNTHFFLQPADGGTARQITDGDYLHGLGGANAQWTPDGRSLLVSANRREDWEHELMDSEVWEFSVEDGTARALTDRRGPDANPAISPDGMTVAYTGFDDRYQGHQVTHLYLMKRDGTGSQKISLGLDRDIGSLTWAPDGSGIYFTYVDQGLAKLGFWSRLDGLKEVAAGLGGRASAYAGANGYSVARNGTVTFVLTDSDRPSDIAVLQPGRPLKIITSLNEDLLCQRTLGEVEEIWYPSEKDGRNIHGWILKPPGFDPGKTYPLILEIHGGPFAAYGPGFDIEKQLLAAGGYVVLYTNPRGSTSYGEEFGNLIHHAYPGDDFYDLNSGIDAMLSRGYINEDELYVTGGSGGGVLTCWMIGRSDRFRAAVTLYPVINWESWVLTADMATMGLKYWFPGAPWDHQEHYDKRSLLSVVKNVKTPTMVLCGEEDWRTPMSESEQYYTALRHLGVESVLVRIPGEAHGTRNRPSHHISKIFHVRGWFDEHRAEVLEETEKDAPTETAETAETAGG